jgi:hypothetical protein
MPQHASPNINGGAAFPSPVVQLIQCDEDIILQIGAPPIVVGALLIASLIVK